MTLPLSSFDPTYRIYLTLAQYPMLRRRIRIKMRQESRKALLSAVARSAVRSSADEAISQIVRRITS